MTAAPPSASPHVSRGLHIALWATQIIVALLVGFSGWIKFATPLENLRQQIPWTADAAPFFVRGLGLTECLAAIGLILPGAIGMGTRWTAGSAAVLVVIMTGATIGYMIRGESIVAVLIVGMLAAWIVWGRCGPVGSGVKSGCCR